MKTLIANTTADQTPGCYFVVDGPRSSTGLSYDAAYGLLRALGRGTVVSVPGDED